MRFTGKLPNGLKMTVLKTFWTGKTSLLIGKKTYGPYGWMQKEPLNLTLEDGSELVVKVKHDWLDPLPYVFIDEKDVFSGQRLHGWQKVVVCLPLVLVLQLGLVPGIVGFGLCYFNFFVARSKGMRPAGRWALIAITPLVGLIITLTSATIINRALGLERQVQQSSSSSSSSIANDPDFRSKMRNSAVTQFIYKDAPR